MTLRKRSPPIAASDGAAFGQRDEAADWSPSTRGCRGRQRVLICELRHASVSLPTHRGEFASDLQTYRSSVALQNAARC
jgi:hypothetical protein